MERYAGLEIAEICGVGGCVMFMYEIGKMKERDGEREGGEREREREREREKERERERREIM